MIYTHTNGVMEFGMSRGIKLKIKYVRISMKAIGRNLDGPPNSYVMFLEF